MEKFRFLEHTADAKMQAFGSSMEEAFSNAALGMFSLMLEPEKVEGKEEKSISVQGSDTKALLYNWLEELLFLLDSEGFVMHEVKSLEIKGRELDAVVTGDRVSGRYETHGEVKAATYNEMEIREENGGIVLQVVLDL